MTRATPAQDPARTPVIVGVGQHTCRTHEGEPYMEPAALIAAAVRQALTDAGTASARVGSLRLVRSLSCRGYRNAPALVAAWAGIVADQVVDVVGGGESGAAAVARACAEITAGTHDVAVVAGGETWYSATRAHRAGTGLEVTEQAGDVGAPTREGVPLDFVHPVERARGVQLPVLLYPLLEDAIRGRAGRSVAAHRDHLGSLVARFSAAAADNPHAWDRTRHDATDIVTPSASNRLVGEPYTKLMVSDEQVDVAAAIVVASAAWARRHGVAPDRWVFPLGAVAADTVCVSERWELHEPALAREVGAALWSHTGLAPSAVSVADLYSCFPSAVQSQADGLGLDPNCPRSLTGGMRFAGGPWCSYALHGTAATVERLRGKADAVGVATGNGGAVTKLVALALATEPIVPFRFVSAQEAVDRLPRRRVTEDAVVGATVEAATVQHGRGGVIERGIVLARTTDGGRTVGVVTAPDDVAAMSGADLLGRAVDVGADGDAHLA